MALLTDDQDITTTYMRTMLGGNGDFYIELINADGHYKTTTCIRVSTSGGNAPTEVKIAVAELFRAMEKHGLNEYPK